MEVSLTKRNLYRAIGEMAYIMTQTDLFSPNSERHMFQKALQEFLGKDSWVAEDRFNRLDLQGEHVDEETTYNRVIFMIRQNKQGLDDELINKFLAVLEKVRSVTGEEQEEVSMVERFKEDVMKIHRGN